jgi:hypothetical protein
MRPALPCLLAFVLVACARVEPPPAGAEESLHWLYEHAGEADDASLVAAISNFEAELGGNISPGFDAPLSGPLLQREIADTGLANDPSATFGIVAATEVACPLARMEAMHVALDQNALHGGYDAYRREYNTVAADYFAKTPLLGWDTQYTLTVAGITYTAKLKGTVRSVAADAARFPSGRVVVGRAWLKEPGVYAEGSDSYFRQDYQLDLLYERGAGRTVHVFAAWREMKMAFFGPEDMTNFMRSGARSADETLARKCAE